MRVIRCDHFVELANVFRDRHSLRMMRFKSSFRNRHKRCFELRCRDGCVTLMSRFLSFIRAAAPVMLALGLSLMLTLSMEGGAVESPPARLAPLADDYDAPELALLMGDLQRLTHKLALSADAGNAELVSFYLHESLEQLKTIQTTAPEYERLPIALLIDRLGLPAYATLQTAVTEKPVIRERLLQGLDAVVLSCNACHVATQHGFLRITRGTEVNPFNQSFAQ